MLLELMRECKNFFDISEETGNFVIDNNIISLSNDYIIDQYILITGSVLNNGIYKIKDNLYTLENSKDEGFTGTIYGLAIPKDFIKLSETIEKYIQDNPQSNKIREKIGSYDVSMASNEKGTITWQQVFARDLNPFRRMFKHIDI